MAEIKIQKYLYKYKENLFIDNIIYNDIIYQYYLNYVKLNDFKATSIKEINIGNTIYDEVFDVAEIWDGASENTKIYNVLISIKQ